MFIAPQPNSDDLNSSDPFTFDAFNQSDDALDSAGSIPALTPIGYGSAIGQSPTDSSAAFAPITLGYGWGRGSSVATSGSSPGASQIVSTSGSGLIFDNTYASGDSAAYIACIVAAEKQLESLFTNSITINVTFVESNSGNSGVLLHNNYSNVNVSYATLKSKLPAMDTDLPSTDPSGGAGFAIPEAYARLLGLSSSTPAVDVTVTLNSYYNWSYGQDVINGVTHELTEGGMGRVGGLGDDNGIWSTMDLFRFSAPDTPDYTDGRDGKTTYFSYNGVDLSSTSVPLLSFNNEYNFLGKQINTGDVADWTQDAVFGTGVTGETVTLNQTELNVMEALGWKATISQDILTTSANWQTPTAWSEGSMPITTQDAFIGMLNSVEATSDNNVTVNSIGTNAESTLFIGGDSIFTATDGTVVNPASTHTLATGNLGGIDVDGGSTMVIGGATTFYNAGILALGVGGSSYLDLGGAVTLSGGGEVVVEGQESLIQSAPSASGGLANVNNTISGGGSIVLASFDNQSGGTVDSDSFLQIGAAAFSNEGAMTGEAKATLDLGQDGATRSLANTGSIDVDSDADLAISGNFTISGSGAISMNGGGAEITSDGLAAATFTNGGSIEALASGQIGDIGKLTSNDLTFDNNGTTLVDRTGATLTLDTGGNLIDDEDGGTLEANNGGVLVIDSDVDTGSYFGEPTSVVKALSGGVVMLAASIVDGVPSQFFSTAGEVLIDAGTFDALGGSSYSGSIEFTGSGGILELAETSTLEASITGFAIGDSIELEGFDAEATESVANDVLTVTDGALARTLHLQGATYTTAQFGVIQVSGGFDILSLQTSFTGGGFVLDLAAGSASSASLSNTADVWDLVYSAVGTVDLYSAQTAVVGAGNTIVFASGSGNAASLYDTGGSFDLVSGSNGTVYLESAQVVTAGGADTIDFLGGSGNVATVSATAGRFDMVNGSNGTVDLSSGQAVVAGGGDTIDIVFGSGNAATVSGTAGDFDMVNGSNCTVYLTSGQAVVTGETNTVDFVSGSDDAVTVAGTKLDFDMVNGSNGTVYLTSGQAVVTGETNTIDFISGTDDAVTVAGTAGHFDTVNDLGSNGTVYLTGGQAVMNGSGGNTIDFISGSGDAVTIAGSAGHFDTVNGSNGTVYLTSGQAVVTGDDNTVDFISGSGDAVTVAGDALVSDQVNNDGASGTVYLTSGQATVTGDSDTIDMMGTSTMTQSGASDAFVFQAGIGVEKISGFASTDSMQFSMSDFANFAAMMSHTFQSGSATVIKLDSSDKVTLTNTLDTSLVASQFHFV